MLSDLKNCEKLLERQIWKGKETAGRSRSGPSTEGRKMSKDSTSEGYKTAALGAGVSRKQ